MTIRLLLASDFDGTLAPIQRDPTTVAIAPEAYDLFRRASALEGVAVAFISGRDLDDLRKRTSGIAAWRSGSHGQEIEGPDGELISTASPRASAPSEQWERRALSAGFRIERKKFGYAIHWRDVEGVREDHPLLLEFAEWADAAGLETTHGRCVLEAAVPGASKRKVLEEMIALTGAEQIAYAGDDVTDLGAIELAAERGRGFFVRSRERSVELSPAVEVVDSLEELLSRFRDLLPDDRR